MFSHLLATTAIPRILKGFGYVRLLRPESCLGEFERGTATLIYVLRGVKIAATPHTGINQIFPPTPLNFATKSETCWKTVAFLVR